MTEKEIKDRALRDLPGAALDAADNDKVNAKMVEEATKELNDNPRYSNGIDPEPKQ